MKATHALIGLAVLLFPGMAHGQLNGNYVVGPAGFGNYPTISAAVANLHTFGVSGPVTISILPGAYPEQVNFQSIAGTSATNLVTFVSSTGNAADVIVGPAPSGTHTFDLADVKHVVIEHVSIMVGTDGVIGTYPRGCEVRDCIITGVLGGPTVAGVDLEDAKGCAVLRNELSNVGYAVRIGSTGLGTSENLSVNENTIDCACAGVELLGVKHQYIKQNRIVVSGNGCAGNGIRSDDGSGVLRIDGNKVTSTAGVSCLEVEGFVGVANQPARIINNMLINRTDAMGQIAMTLDACAHADVFHNSAQVTFQFANVVQMYDVGNVRFKGNIVRAATDGMVLFIDGLTGSFTSDYNLFDTPLSYAFTLSPVGYTAADWQTAGYDANSVFGDPLFVSDLDLHLTATSPARNLVPLSTGVVDDFDGEARPWPANNLSDMGCDEWATGVGGGQKNALVGNEDAFIEVSPNPATDHFRVTFDSSEKQAYQLYRSDGVLVQSGSILSGEPIPVSDLSPGIHFLLLPQVPGAITRLVIAD